MEDTRFLFVGTIEGTKEERCAYCYQDWLNFTCSDGEMFPDDPSLDDEVPHIETPQ